MKTILKSQIGNELKLFSISQKFTEQNGYSGEWTRDSETPKVVTLIEVNADELKVQYDSKDTGFGVLNIADYEPLECYDSSLRHYAIEF